MAAYWDFTVISNCISEQFDMRCTAHWNPVWSHVHSPLVCRGLWQSLGSKPFKGVGTIFPGLILHENPQNKSQHFCGENRILLMKWTMQKGGVPYFVYKIDRFCKSGGVHWKFIKPLHIWRESSSDRMNIYFCVPTWTRTRNDRLTVCCDTISP